MLQWRIDDGFCVRNTDPILVRCNMFR